MTVSTTGRLLFLSCFMNSPDLRRNVVNVWMSLVISSIRTSYTIDSTFKGALSLSEVPCFPAGSGHRVGYGSPGAASRTIAGRTHAARSRRVAQQVSVIFRIPIDPTARAVD
ncbi:hypothetical protein SBA6_360017 [Candidatus Sulfopaludibacter sp. SbA6]|nr:hypothetical protein SBA6_360017 [Candidatus Sulfopaludibacter sp. SbA6]